MRLLLRAGDITRRTGINYQFLYKLVRSGAMPVVRIGGKNAKFFFRKCDVEKVLQIEL